MPLDTHGRRPRTVERRVAFLSVLYKSSELNAIGEKVEVLRSAKRGELATFSLVEASRLDALGALAPEGASAQDIEAAIEATYQQYRAQRQAMPSGV